MGEPQGVCTPRGGHCGGSYDRTGGAGTLWRCGTSCSCSRSPRGTMVFPSSWGGTALAAAGGARCGPAEIALADHRGAAGAGRRRAAAGRGRVPDIPLPRGRGLTGDRGGGGEIGGAVASGSRPFEVQLTRWPPPRGDDAAGHVHGTDELGRILPRTDILVLALPLTASTVGLVDREMLSRLPDDALAGATRAGALATPPPSRPRCARDGPARRHHVGGSQPLPGEHPLMGAAGRSCCPTWAAPTRPTGPGCGAWSWSSWSVCVRGARRSSWSSPVVHDVRLTCPPIDTRVRCVTPWGHESAQRIIQVLVLAVLIWTTGLREPRRAHRQGPEPRNPWTGPLIHVRGHHPLSSPAEHHPVRHHHHHARRTQPR
ncbi:NAD(P)-dependent oxidoreductase [Kocuria rhizophila]|nr:NAD(P)-dependent oxidoreductase [Kocuria rhizophila]